MKIPEYTNVSIPIFDNLINPKNSVKKNSRYLFTKKNSQPIFAAHPNFLVKPRDQRVGMNGIAKFDCEATGNPPPSVFWTKEGSQELMFAGTTHGQMFVSQEGTLTIQV